MAVDQTPHIDPIRLMEPWAPEDEAWRGRAAPCVGWGLGASIFDQLPIRPEQAAIFWVFPTAAGALRWARSRGIEPVRRGRALVFTPEMIRRGATLRHQEVVAAHDRG